MLLCGDEDYKKETLNTIISHKIGGRYIDFISPCYSTSSYSKIFQVSRNHIKSSQNNFNNSK